MNLTAILPYVGGFVTAIAVGLGSVITVLLNRWVAIEKLKTMTIIADKATKNVEQTMKDATGPEKAEAAHLLATQMAAFAKIDAPPQIVEALNEASVHDLPPTTPPCPDVPETIAKG